MDLINKTVLLYPFSDCSYGIVNYLIRQNVTVIPTVSESSSYVNKSIGFSVNRNNENVFVQSIKDVEVNEINYFVISSNAEDGSIETDLDEICVKISKSQTEVFYLGNDENIKLYIQKNFTQNYHFELKENLVFQEKLEKIEKSSYVNIDFPVIFVGGLVESEDSLEIALSIKESIDKLGYNSLIISKNLEIQFANGLSFPKYFMTNHLNPEEQMEMLVNWLNNAIKLRNPDLIIVDLPKGLLTYNTKIHNSFGIFSIMISLIIKPDYLVVALNNVEQNEKELIKYSQHFESRLGKAVDVYHLSNRYFKVYAGDYMIPNKPLFISSDIIKNTIMSFNIESTMKIEDLNAKENIDAIIQKFIKKFSNKEIQ